AFEIAARNAPGGVTVFAIVNRERKEIRALLRLTARDGRDQHHRLSLGDQHRAVSLFCDTACFDREFTAAYIYSLFQKHFLSPLNNNCHSSFVICHLSLVGCDAVRMQSANDEKSNGSCVQD